MEAFSLLKYWRGGGGVFTRDAVCNQSSSSFSSSGSTTIVTTVTPNSSSSSDSDDEGNDDGPFFDLEFTLPDDDDDEKDSGHNRAKNQLAESDVAVMAPQVVVLRESGSRDCNVDEKEFSGEGDVSNEDDDDDDQNDGAAEINFTISSCSTGDPNDSAVFPTGSSSDPVNAAASETTPKFPVPSILKSATKFRVQMLKFNKSKKPTKSEARGKKTLQKEEQAELKEKRAAGSEDPKPNNTNNKLLTVKLKVEEVLPLVSLLFSRDHSNSSANSKGLISNSNSKTNKRNGFEIDGDITDFSGENNATSSSSEDEKKFAKELMNKYLKKVKPLYVRVSKRYGDKLRFSGQLGSALKSATVPPPDCAQKPPLPVVEASEEGTVAEEEGAVTNNNVLLKGQKQGNLQAGLRVVCKHLGKSRSASASAPAPGPGPAAGTESSRRRDDSLLLQQDGIQSAIMHCKRSFNASRDMEGTLLSTRSVRISSSDPSKKIQS
ncbi:OLC1v1029892C1 [Oldenlandia corymbosa var. corymbosa]|uniref:OLC1v1029892C1 n=1 Tax=Oldenlandia corymbosa var. corymbosa TaxID=529605 RepID=A0AAV1CHT6_OLDCO|nr:OLC1v1029892C1 [Oldenlandia corymbosa var. corymbosa]